jgi:hypothetical protein
MFSWRYAHPRSILYVRSGGGACLPLSVCVCLASHRWDGGITSMAWHGMAWHHPAGPGDQGLPLCIIIHSSAAWLIILRDVCHFARREQSSAESGVYACLSCTRIGGYATDFYLIYDTYILCTQSKSTYISFRRWYGVCKVSVSTTGRNQTNRRTRERKKHDDDETTTRYLLSFRWGTKNPSAYRRYVLSWERGGYEV